MPLAATNRAEVALIGGEDIETRVPLGQHDARGVGQVEGRKVGLAGEQSACPRQILVLYSVDMIGGLDLFDGG